MTRKTFNAIEVRQLSAPSSPAASNNLLYPKSDGKWYTKDSSGVEVLVAPVTSVAGKTGVVTLVKGDVGLGSVDNTSDVNKPISTATQTALNAKTDKDSVASASMRAQATLTGGGTISVDLSGNVSWSQRFIVMAKGYGQSSNFAAAGYFDISMPANGTVITGVGGASNQTVAGGVISIPVWSSLYYILPIGSGSSTVAANFRMGTYSANWTVPDHWIEIVGNNPENGQFRFANGVNLYLGRTWSAADPRSSIGLDSVDNTSDASKPVSTAQQAALNLKADLASPTFTGDPKAPTPTAGDNDTSIATTAFVQSAIAASSSMPVKRARVSASAVQSMGTGTETIINYSASAVEYDTDGMWNSATPNQLTVNTPGVYLCNWTVSWAAAAGGNRIGLLKKNGASIQAETPNIFSANMGFTFSRVVECAAGDYIQIAEYQSSGGALNTHNQPYPSLEVIRLGDL